MAADAPVSFVAASVMSAMQFLRRWVELFVEPRRILNLRHLLRYFFDWREFNSQAGGASLLNSFPVLGDRSSHTPFDPHYFFQGSWIARELAEASPPLHVDIASSVLTMSVLSAHVPTIFVDYRPLVVRQNNLMSVAGDINSLPFADASVGSLSCLHVIEHIGLGRYGDRVAVGGAKKAARELARVVRNDGAFYLSTPVGRERVCFNAHRISSPHTVVSWFPDMQLQCFSYVDDAGRLHVNAPMSDAEGLSYGCGLFTFRKSPAGSAPFRRQR
jgi:Caenorhabditis protein of unknown function, DUF268